MLRVRLRTYAWGAVCVSRFGQDSRRLDFAFFRANVSSRTIQNTYMHTVLTRSTVRTPTRTPTSVDYDNEHAHMRSLYEKDRRPEHIMINIYSILTQLVHVCGIQTKAHTPSPSPPPSLKHQRIYDISD